MSEKNRLAKVVDIRRWREEKDRQVRPSPPTPPVSRTLALTLSTACCLLGLGLAFLPIWAFVHRAVDGWPLGLLFGLVFPAGLSLTLLGVDLAIRACTGRADEGLYPWSLRLRRPTPPEPGADPPDIDSRPHGM